MGWAPNNYVPHQTFSIPWKFLAGGKQEAHSASLQPTHGHTDDHHLATFKEGLKRLGYSTGWLMQLTASSPVVARDTTCLPPQFPLTKEELASASSAKKKEMCVTTKEVEEIEHLTRGQAANEQWLHYRTCRITASNFGRVCHSTWFKHHDRRISTVATEHGQRLEPEAKDWCIMFQQQQGKHASYC